MTFYSMISQLCGNILSCFWIREDRYTALRAPGFPRHRCSMQHSSCDTPHCPFDTRSQEAELGASTVGVFIVGYLLFRRRLMSVNAALHWRAAALPPSPRSLEVALRQL